MYIVRRPGKEKKKNEKKATAKEGTAYSTIQFLPVIVTLSLIEQRSFRLSNPKDRRRVTSDPVFSELRVTRKKAFIAMHLFNLEKKVDGVSSFDRISLIEIDPNNFSFFTYYVCN